MSHPFPLPDWPDSDQLMFRKVKREWSAEVLLEQKGWFPLSDIMKLLDPHETGSYRRIIHQRERVLEIGKDPVTMMGLRQFGSRLWADMPVFSRWFRQNASVWMEQAPRGWRFPDQAPLKPGFEGAPRGGTLSEESP